MEVTTVLNGIAVARANSSVSCVVYPDTAFQECHCGLRCPIDAVHSDPPRDGNGDLNVKIDEDSLGYFRDARAMRARYIVGLLNGWSNAVLGLLRSVAQILGRGRMERGRDSSS
jgi:hypothetical protein